jgi:hypothetical protein
MIRKMSGWLRVGWTCAGCIFCGALNLSAANSVVTGSVRIELLSNSLVRLETAGAEGFEDRTTFHIRNRNWPGTAFSSNLVSGQIVINTANYTVYVPQNATSLSGVYVASPTGQVLYQYNGTLVNNVWLPGPSGDPDVLSFADTPRLIPPPWGVGPAPPGAAYADTSGWDTNNDAPDVYVLVPNGSYQQMRQDFLQLTGPTEMVPLYALGAFDSRWYDYSETTALAQIESYRSRVIPLDVLVCDTGWRQGASTGYQPNTNLFPNLQRFFAEAHADNVRVMFNDHPQPVASNALDPAEVIYRYTNLTQILAEGLNIWLYDRNWPVSLLSPSPNLQYEVWGMKVYHDATYGTNAPLRPMIMANVDGIDSGIRDNPMDVAAHTFPIQWTGDIQPSLTYLTYAVANAVHSGVQSLFPYESDDLGGHVADPTPGDYIRWIEYGALSPVYRPHCTYDLSRMPWTFGPEAEWTARRFLNLRYRLLPGLYAAARLNYDTGEPLVRRLDLDYSEYPQASQEGQYALGHALLVAPVTQGALATVPAAWLTTTNGQPGLSAAYYANTNLSGTPALTEVDTNINFNWNSGSPGGTVPAVNFSVRWTGNIAVPASVGDIRLAAVSDDGVRVWVDGQLCLANWGPNDSVTTESTTVLSAGQTHQLEVDYLQLGGNDLITLEWRPENAAQSVWIPPGNWINAWSGAVLKGPATISFSAPLEQVPLFVRSGAVFALAPQMQYTGQVPWDPVTLDVYPSTTEADQTSLYEDDGLTTAYQQGQCRWTTIATSADDAGKTVAVSIGPAVGSFSNAPTRRSWVLRIHRPPNWPADLAPAQVTVNGQATGPVIRRAQNATAMPLGADNGAPDADSFEVTLPEGSVAASNLVVAAFQSASSPWVCGDIGDVGGAGNVFEGASTCSNSVWTIRGGGAGIDATNDGFHFLSQPCVGNTQISARLVSQQSGNAAAQAGLIITEGLAPASRNVAIALTPHNEVVFQSRSTNGAAGQTTRTGGFSMPCWLKLVRNGSAIFGYASDNGGALWTQIGSATITGFNSQAYVGLAVTAATSTNTIPATNSFGTVITGACPELLGGSYSVDDTNYNVAVFDNLALNSPVSISTVPNQALAQAGSTPAIPFWVNSSNGNALTVTALSGNTNLLPTQNIVISGTGADLSATLTPIPGVSGTCTVTLTVTDGTNSASTQFTLTVYAPATGAAGTLLLSENFTNYVAGNLPGQRFQGAGFAAGGSWVGLDTSFAVNVPDAGTVSPSGLSSPLYATTGGLATVKGDGSNVEGFPDLSATGTFAAAGLYDPASVTIGGGNVSGTLYLSFLIHADFNTGENAYGGLHLSRGDDTTGVLIGNSAPAWAFSLWYPPTSTSVDLDNDNGTGGYLFVDANTHLIVARISYAAGGNDTLTAWLDPNPAEDENTQNSASTYVGTISGDLSFNRFFLRGGYSGKQFDYGRICFGTSWTSVLPAAAPVGLPAPVIQSASLLSGGQFSLAFSGPAGQSYSVHASTSLALPRASWAVIGTGTFGFSPATLADSMADNAPQRFYFISTP